MERWGFTEVLVNFTTYLVSQLSHTATKQNITTSSYAVDFIYQYPTFKLFLLQHTIYLVH